MITERQRQARDMGIGASECATILGLDPWRTPYDLWLLKTGRHEESGERGSEAREIGNLIEDTIAALAERRIGRRLVKPTATYKADNGIMFANLDRQVGHAKRGSDNCELKSTGLTDGWGEPGSDQIPDRVMIQVHAQMVCCDARVSHVARLLGRFGFSFEMYRVEYNPRLADAIVARVLEFWDNHVEKDVPPAAVPSIDVISHVRRVAGKVIDVGSDVVDAYAVARDARKAAEKNEETAKAQLLAALGDAEVGTAPGWSVSFKTVETKRLDAGAIQKAHPDLCAEFIKSSGYRRLDVREVTQ